MAEEAEHHRKQKNDGARDIRCAALVAWLASDDTNHERKRGDGHDHAARVHPDATSPFLEIIAFRLEYKPLISKEGKRDAEQIGEQAGYDISVGKDWGQKQCEQREAAVTEDRVASADG